MDKADKGALLNPCPPFYRDEEVSEDVIDSDYFVGYEFKKSLLTVQQAIMIFLFHEITSHYLLLKNIESISISSLYLIYFVLYFVMCASCEISVADFP
jgi:hypothetical protein